MCVSGLICVATSSALLLLDADNDAQDTIWLNGVYKSSGSSSAGATCPDLDDDAGETVTGKMAIRSLHDKSKRSVGDNGNGFTEHIKSFRIIVLIGITLPITHHLLAIFASFASSSQDLSIPPTTSSFPRPTTAAPLLA